MSTVLGVRQGTMQSVLTSTIAKLAPGSNAELEALQAEVKSLRDANKQLQEVLAAQQSGAIAMRGYLNKWHEVTSVMGLFSQEWELRWFMLTGSLIRYYKTERDVAFSPRGVVDVRGCLVECEQQRDRYSVFRIVEPGGNLLLRVSTDNRLAAEQWVAALAGAGLRVLPPGQTAAAAAAAASAAAGSASERRLSEPGGADGSSTPLASSSARTQQERWEQESTDSELPFMPKERLRVATRNPTRTMAHSGSSASLNDASPTCRSADDSINNALSSSAAATPSAQQPPPHPPRGRRPSGGPPTAAAAAKALRPPMVGSTPVHTSSRYSCLSGDGVWAAQHSGLFNLGMVILITTNLRLILENLLKYGLRFNLVRYVRHTLSGRGNLRVLLCFPALVAFPLAALAIEWLALAWAQQDVQLLEGLRKKAGGEERDAHRLARLTRSRMLRGEWFIFALNLVNTTASLVLPCAMVSVTKRSGAHPVGAMPLSIVSAAQRKRGRSEPGAGFALTALAIVVWMKLVSWGHCNWDLRLAHRQNQLRPGERGAPDADPSWARLRYPENLTVKNMAYFLAVPTLTYQVNFPRSERIRKRWLLNRVVELAAFLGLGLFIVDQYMAPAVANSMQPLRELAWMRLLERVLKLAIPNLYCWLIMFYCLFHLWLNILAELTLFGDREFYKEWWNSATVGEYWRSWNQPVHKWLLRTVYFPAMRHGVPRYPALVLVFFVSAVLHEVALGVPLQMVRWWAFAGIMLQVPLTTLSESMKKRLKSDVWGNVIFWISFCILGQPVSLLMYAHDYAFEHRQLAPAEVLAAEAMTQMV